MLLWFAVSSRINSMRNEPFFLQPIPAKGTRKLSEKRQVATAIFNVTERKG
jgi:hypothetical protein